MIALRTFGPSVQRDILTALQREQFQLFGPGTHGGNRPVERDEFHALNSSQIESRRVGHVPVTHDIRNQLAKGGCRQRWHRFRIVMMRRVNENLAGDLKPSDNPVKR
jgi:hypothetical protein